ncbi:menaquinone biosynthesis protein [Desulfovibrio sp. OttesenSCG-928-A18]|nr:menaquinone biosynthesis protein [Desulfovibrio sp. OttesenSCG-928-A18]
MNAENPREQTRPRMGRIGYLNVLPLYHALESGEIAHDYELVYGPPAELNRRMAAGEMLAASTSCVEYARRPERYLLLQDLAIGSKGPVQSVLLLSRVPVAELEGRRILVSAETHTSAALLRMLLDERYGLRRISYHTGSATELAASGNPPTAFLAIGDEALRLRRHPLYPHVLDLGEAWINWTGLPFVFGVWVADRAAFSGNRTPQTRSPGALLREGRAWGERHMDRILDIAVQNYPHMSRREHEDYFTGLSYSLGPVEQQGLLLFWQKLAARGEIARAPALDFLDDAR